MVLDLYLKRIRDFSVLLAHIETEFVIIFHRIKTFIPFLRRIVK